MKNLSSILSKSLALLVLISVLTLTLVQAQPDTTSSGQKVVKLNYTTNINGKLKTVDTTFMFPEAMTDDDISQLVEDHMNRLSEEGESHEFDFNFFPGKDFPHIWGPPDVEEGEWALQLEALAKQMKSYKMQDSSLKKEMDALRYTMPDPEEFAKLYEHFNMTDFNSPCPPPCRAYRHHGNRFRGQGPAKDCHIYMFGDTEENDEDQTEKFFWYGDDAESIAIDSNFSIIQGNGDTIVLKGNKKIIVKGEPFEFEHFNNKDMNIEVFTDSISDSMQVRVQIPKAPRVKILSKKFKQPHDNNFFSNHGFGRQAHLKDLNEEDIQQMKGTALKPAKKYQLLGVEHLSVENLEPGLISLNFSLGDDKETEIQLFDNSGELVHHEITKKIVGDYYKEIQTGMADALYLKIRQGGKSFIKKILL
jgi:hypothetical protein